MCGNNNSIISNLKIINILGLYILHFICKYFQYLVHLIFLLNVGTVPLLCILNAGTVSMLFILNVRSEPRKHIIIRNDENFLKASYFFAMYITYFGLSCTILFQSLHFWQICIKSKEKLSEIWHLISKISNLCVRLMMVVLKWLSLHWVVYLQS